MPPQSAIAPCPPSADIRRAEARLLSRIHRHYETLTEIVDIGPMAIRFTRIADPNLVLDKVAQEEDLRERLEAVGAGLPRPRSGDGRSGKPEPTGEPLHLPYWAELWDSALGIGQFLIDYCADQSLEQHSVLDLGCGMGLTGTVAAALGARVVFADLEPPALLFAAINSLPWRDRARFRRLDWRRDDLHERFSLILGADILYEKSQWVFLAAFWRKHLAKNGAVLLGEPGRQTGELFIPWIRQHGWSLRQYAQSVPTRSRPLRLFWLEPGK